MQRRELRALVLHLDEALHVSGFRGERRPAPVRADRDAQADRRQRRRLGAQMRERLQRLLARGLQEVGAQIDRRAVGERPPLLRGVRAEGGLELRREPFGIVAGDMRGGALKRRGREPLALGLAQRRRRVALAGEQRRDRLEIEPARLLERADRLGARRRFAHQPGARRLAAQRVIDEAGNRRAVARAREPVRQAPILHRVGGGTAAGFDVGEDLDGGGNAGCGSHAPSCRKTRAKAKSDAGANCSRDR